MSEGIRADKYLWAVRIFKTRSLATEFCKSGKVTIDGDPIKPSRMIRLGDVIQVKKTPVTYTYQVTGLTEKRGSATVAAAFVVNLTPPEELERVRIAHESAFYTRDRGTGRPTKKERRIIDKLDL